MRRGLLLVGVVALVVAVRFVWRNASIEHLRAEFRPWMARLERWRGRTSRFGGRSGAARRRRRIRTEGLGGAAARLG